MRSLASPLFSFSRLSIMLSLVCSTLVAPLAHASNTQSVVSTSLIQDNTLQNTSGSLIPSPRSSMDRQAIPDHFNPLVLYFSLPEEQEFLEKAEASEDSIWALTGASFIFNKHKDEVQGNVEYMAKLIGQMTSAPLVRIESTDAYPTQHDALIARSVEEFDAKSRPAIRLTPELNLNDYDTIFLGYPVWWNDLPMPLYTFLEQYDLSDKRVLLFCSYDQSNPFNTFKIISHLEPNARFIKNLSIERAQLLEKAQKRIENWLNDLTFSGSSDTTFHLNKNSSPIILLKE